MASPGSSTGAAWLRVRKTNRGAPMPTSGKFLAKSMLAVLALATTPARAVTVVLNLEIQVIEHLVGDGLGFAAGEPEPGFVPFTVNGSVQFDADVRETLGDDREMALGFVGNNVFTSPLTAMLPWSPPFATPAFLDRDLAIFESGEAMGRSGAAWQRFYNYFPEPAGDYRYFAALYSNPDGSEPFVDADLSWGTDEFLAYLEMLRTEQRVLIYEEDAWIYDGVGGVTVDRDKYTGHARITSIQVVPVPPAALMLGSALAALAGLRRRPADNHWRQSTRPGAQVFIPDRVARLGRLDGITADNTQGLHGRDLDDAEVPPRQFLLDQLVARIRVLRHVAG